MLIGDWFKSGLTIVGSRTPKDGPRLLNGAANFLETGRLLRERDIAIPSRVSSRFQLFDIAIDEMDADHPLYLEFGVYKGETIRYWVDRLASPDALFFGFDSFEGLPEDWTSAAGQGHFSTDGQIPNVVDRRVRFVKGWFEDSLDSFEMSEHDRLFINIDSDLYSSAMTVLDWVTPHFAVGDFLYFDEFHDRLNEGRAFREFLDKTGYRLEMVAATRSLSQVLFRRAD
jgi:Macrocin-O-methyltransferase (TylF)